MDSECLPRQVDAVGRYGQSPMYHGKVAAVCEQLLPLYYHQPLTPPLPLPWMP